MSGTFAFARSRVAVLAGALVALLTATLVGAPPAAAEHFEDVREIDALEGIGASVAYSKLAFPDGATGVVLTRANIFADSLASGLLQGSRPLLLTASGSLSPATKAEIERLGARNVTILGGASAISRSIEDDLREDGYRVNRLSGASRVETAVAVARSVPGPRVALLARAFGTDDPTSAFADTLSAGAWSADRGWPVLLTETATLSAPTAEYLRSGIDQVWVVGGQAAVSETVLSQVRALGVAATRVSGPNRFETAMAVARQRGFATGADADDIVLVDGQGENAWKDGFAAAAFAAQNDAPVVLANSAASELPASTLAFLKQAPTAQLLVGWTVPAAQTDAAAEGMGKEPGVTRIMTVAMSGQNVVRPGSSESFPIWGYGEPNKTGTLTMTVDDEKNTIDYQYQSNATGPYVPATASSSGLMIRRGAVDKRDGEIVVRFPSPPTNGSMSGKLTSTSFASGFSLRQLIDAPSGFYAESYTQGAYSTVGAVRGQLPSGGTAHLPGPPTFSSIETKQGDDWITLKFAAPVFLANGVTLAATDFDVRVRNGVAVNVASADAPTTASGASDSFVIKLATGSPAPAAGTEVVVTLKGSGAQKLKNNLGAVVGSGDVTQRHTTVADTSVPELTSIEAAANTNVVRLNFSEPVYTAGSVTPIVRVISGSTTLTPTPGALNVGRDARAKQHSLQLTFTGGGGIPAGAEVQVEFTSAGASAADKVQDPADNKLRPVLRTTTASTASGALVDATVTDLVVGGGGTGNDTSGQTQTVTAKLQGAMPGGSNVKFTFPTTSAYPEVDPVLGGFPTGSIVDSGTQTGSPDRRTFTVTLPSSGLPDGAVVSLTAVGVNVPSSDAAETTGGGTGTAQTVHVQRSDTGHVASPKFDRKRGVFVKDLGYTESGAIRQQVITLQMRAPATVPSAGVGISIDLTDMTARGVDYPESGTSGVTVTSSTGASIGSGAFAGNPVTRLQLTPTSNFPLNSDIVVTITLDAALPHGGLLPGVQLPVERTDPGSAVNRWREGAVAMTDLTWTGNQTQFVAMRLYRDISSTETIETTSPLTNVTWTTNSATVEAGPAGTVSNTANVLKYTPPANLPSGTLPAGTLVVLRISGVEARNASANVTSGATVRRTVPPPTGNTPVERKPGPSYPSVVSLRGVPDIRLTEAAQTVNAPPAGAPAKVFGDAAGDTITLTFTANMGTPVNAGNATAPFSSFTVANEPTVIKCGSHYKTDCSLHPTDKKIVLIRSTDGSGSQIEFATTKKIGNVFNFPPETSGQSVGAPPDHIELKAPSA